MYLVLPAAPRAFRCCMPADDSVLPPLYPFNPRGNLGTAGPGHDLAFIWRENISALFFLTHDNENSVI